MKKNRFLYVAALLCCCQATPMHLWALPVNSTTLVTAQEIQRVMPEDGKMYRIAAITKDHKYYLTVDENDGLTTSTEVNNLFNQIWKCTENVDGTFCFRLMHTENYLAFKTVSTAAEAFELDPANAVTEGGLPLRAPRQSSSYMLVRNSNGAFDQSTVKWTNNQDYSSDYVFEEVTEIPALPALNIDMTQGTKNGDANAAYFDTWTTNGGVAVVLKNTYKNFALTNGVLHLYRGASTAPYVIQAPQGMVIESYTLTFTNASETAMTVTPSGQEGVTCSSTETEATVQVTGVNAQTASFDVTAAGNTALKVNSFQVTLKYAEGYTIQEALEEEYGSLLFEGVDAEFPYRIPAITTTRNGRLISFSDWRPCNNDIGYGEVDILIRTSDDNGKTWQAAKTIMDGTDTYGYGDAAVVADRTSDEVLLMAAAGKVVFFNSTREIPIRVAVSKSTDNGETWTEPADVTDEIYNLFPEEVKGIFFTSGRIIQSSIIKKDQYYRLYVAAVIRTTSNAVQNYVLYSDDFGTSWQILGGGPAISSGADEAKCEELSDGTVIIASRKSGGRTFNVFTYDENKEAGTWATAVASNSVTGGLAYGANACNGEMLIVPAIKKETGEKKNILLLTVPTGAERSNVSFYYKEITPEGLTPNALATGWSDPQLVTPVYSGYSALTLQKDGSIGLFLEDTMFGARSYNMNYRNFTLSTITRGAYEVDRSLEISSDQEFAPIYNGIYDVTLNRNFVAGWNSVCLPFSIEASKICEGAIAQEYSSYSESGLNFVKVDQMEAGKPYLLYCPSEVNEAIALNEVVLEAGEPQTVCPASSPFQFKGSYQPISMEGLYGVARVDETDKLMIGGSNSSLKATGAYFELLQASQVQGMNVFFEGDNTTAIVEMEGEQTSFDVYSIGGTLVRANATTLSGLPKGIYIVRGEKVIVK